MPEDIITEHHCVPHSFDGAGTSVNLSHIPETEHQAFHDAIGHAPPDFFLRRFLIGSVGWKDRKERSLPPGMYEDVLALLAPDDWHTLYQPGTFIATHDRSDGESLRRAKAAFHLAWYLDREMSLIMDQIGLLGIHKLPPFATAKEMQRVHQFFDKNRPHVVMRKFLLDTDADDTLKWAKPMRDDIRKELLDVLRLSKLERLTSNGSSQRIFDLLLDHHERLVHCTKIWEPNLRDHGGTLKRLSQQS